FARLALSMNSAAAGQAFSQACVRLIAAGPLPADRVALLQLTAQTLLSGYHVNVRPALRVLSGTGPAQPAHAGPAPAEELRGALAATFDAAKAAQGGATAASAAGLHVAASALAALALLEQGDQDAAAAELNDADSTDKAHHMIVGLHLYVRGGIETSRGRAG